ncbi:hypothetical protein [Streptomyces celluloflavus]|uniref:hypothetical protein n=1 Tax=Streptomyces celluloflavus TaxID=58344 RepID=UPI00367F6473
MSAPVDAERAWQDLQRIRVPQERVYDEIERCPSGGRRATYTTAAIMWLYLAGQGLDLGPVGVWLALVGYVALLLTLAVLAGRRVKVRLRHSRYTWRSFAVFFAAALLAGATIGLSSWLTTSLALPCPSLIKATLSAGAFLLFAGPANRWAVGSLRGHRAGEPPRGHHERAGR